MEAFLMVSGIQPQINVMDEGIRFGQTAQYMMATGKMIRRMVEAASFMQMETFMMAIGRMTRQMVLVFTSISKVPNTKGIGRTTSSMVKARRSGLMVLGTKDRISLAKKKVLVSLIGQMDQVIKVTS